MLDMKKELAMVETNFSSTSNKRSPFHLLSSIFSKKKQIVLDNDAFEKTSKDADNHSSNVPQKELSNTEDPSTSQCCSNDTRTLDDTKVFHSPLVQARRNHLRVDLETLHLSRQDNPYLKQLERFSLPEETLLSSALAENALLQSEWYVGTPKKDVDIHQHLVRSPPPQFPQNLSHFMYSQTNSPERQIKPRTESCNNVQLEGSKRSLNPVQPKREFGMLDPGIKEVLEYQKSQLRAGLQHKFGTAPAHYVPVEKIAFLMDSRGILIQDSGSRATATTSLPNYLNFEQTSKKMIPLGPIKIGRALSDSICHDSIFRN